MKKIISFNINYEEYYESCLSSAVFFEELLSYQS